MNIKGTYSYTTHKYSDECLGVNFVPFCEDHLIYMISDLSIKLNKTCINKLKYCIVYGKSIATMFDFRLFVGYL